MDEPGKHHCCLRGPAAQADISRLTTQGGPGLQDPETWEHSGPKGYLLHDPTFWKHLKKKKKENIWRSDGLRSPGLPSPLADSFWGHTLGHQPLFFFLISAIKKKNLGSSLVIQWLWLCTSNTWNSGSIPGHGTRIPHNHMRNPKTKARSCLIKLK